MKETHKNHIFVKALSRLLPAVGFLGASLIASRATSWYWTESISKSWWDHGNVQSQSSGGLGVPLSGNSVLVRALAARGLLINNGGNAALNAVYGSKDMTITAGGVLNTIAFKLGWDASATLTVSGGALWASDPEKMVVTAINPGFVGDTFVQWNPEVFSNLTSSLDQSMALVPAGVEVLAGANYSFGCAGTTNGDIYFTEFNSMRISKYHPGNGTVTTVVTNRGAVYGIAVDTAGNIFYAQDSASGAGRVVWRTSSGSEQTIITNLTNPRQLATDTAGNLYVVIEAGQILKWTKSTGLTTTLLDQAQMLGLPQGVAVTSDGRIYFSTYATVGVKGTELAQGKVWVRETNGAVRVIAGGISRGRGLALDDKGNLYVAAEANVWDNGNSGVLIQIATNGVVTRVASGIDYLQFPTIGADGKIYFTLARDNKLVAYDPRNSFAPQVISGHGLTLIAEGATWQQSAGNGLPVQLNITNTNNPADAISIKGWLNITDGSGRVNMWLNIPVTNFNISLAQIPDPNNGNTNTGMFALPAVSVNWAYGSAKSFVLPLREHRRSRWPVLNDDNPALISFPSDFGETPTAYLVYLSVAAPRRSTYRLAK